MDEFLREVRGAAAGNYEVFGELGRESDEDIWYLARDLQSHKLVALHLTREDDGSGNAEYELEVARELDKSVAVGLGECRECGTSLRRWARFCTQCGADLNEGAAVPTSPEARERLLDQVRMAASEYYDVLGEMPWADGAGIVYFAMERSSGRLVRLRLRQDADGASLRETRVMMGLKDQVQASYVTSIGAGREGAYVSEPPADLARPAWNRGRPVPRQQKLLELLPGIAGASERERRLVLVVYVLGGLVLILLLRDLIQG
jgi:hypothetical protein